MEEVTDGFSISVDEADAFDKVAGVAFHVDRIFVPVAIFVCLFEFGFEGGVELALRVEDETWRDVRIWRGLSDTENIPSAHDVGLATKHFGQATN